MNEHDDVDADVRKALAEALGERKIRMTDRRLLILYSINIAIVFVVSLALFNADARDDEDRRVFQRAVVQNCRANQENVVNFNEFIDTLVKTVTSSRLLTDAEKQQRIEFYSQGKGQVPTCPRLKP